MGEWTALPLDKPLYANLDEDAVIGFQTAIENGYLNDLGGHSRFPGLTERVSLGGNAPVYLHDFGGDGIATSQGQVYRFDRNFTVENLTAVPVSGGRRTVFAKTDRDLLMAAGGPIVRLRNTTTELLSDDAPLASHVAWIDNFTIAVEINSQRFFHSGPGTPDKWDPLDTFAADGSPDNINSVLVTPARELLLGGEDSVEQFERSSSNDPPFDRRWAIAGGGVKLPYAFSFIDNFTWTINSRNELVRFNGQVPEPMSDSIGRLLQRVDDWTDAWMSGPLLTEGQKFIVIQMPRATNPNGSKGLTLLCDYRAKKFSTLYGWDAGTGETVRWPGWSHWRLWDRNFIGGEGKIYELDPASFRNGTDTQRWLVRTSHLAKGSGAIINGFRLRLVRGRGTSEAASTIRVRCSRDGRPFGTWISRSLGLAGSRTQHIEFGSFGAASTHRFEISSTDDVAIDLISAEVKVEPVEIGN